MSVPLELSSLYHWGLISQLLVEQSAHTYPDVPEVNTACAPFYIIFPVEECS